jgi:hypothetical protein
VPWPRNHRMGHHGPPRRRRGAKREHPGAAAGRRRVGVPRSPPEMPRPPALACFSPKNDKRTMQNVSRARRDTAASEYQRPRAADSQPLSANKRPRVPPCCLHGHGQISHAVAHSARHQRRKLLSDCVGAHALHRDRLLDAKLCGRASTRREREGELRGSGRAERGAVVAEADAARTVSSGEFGFAARALAQQDGQLRVRGLDRGVVLRPKVTAGGATRTKTSRTSNSPLAGRGERAHRTPAEPAPVWHMATRSSISAFDAVNAMRAVF